VKNDGRGAGAARNTGAAAAEGTHIAFLDADDRFAESAVRRRLDASRRSPESDLVWGHVRCFRSPDLPPEEARRLACPEGALPARLPGAMLVTHEAFDRVGPFVTGLRVGEFVDWGARAQELNLNQREIDDVVLWRRLHATNQGRLHADARGDYARVVRAALQRRRGSVAE
jgi:glycosyltransferase involved in cell wall biosynthesis